MPGGIFIRVIGKADIIAQFLAFILIAGVIVSRAWVGDDAFITFRSIENFTSGYGPVYNLGQRVQVFTHPLWMMLISILYAPMKWTGTAGQSSLYGLTIVVSLCLSLAAVSLISFRLANNYKTGLIAISLLAASSAFVDYGTSGLENPLAYCLIAIFVILYLDGAVQHSPNFRWLGRVGFVAGLIALTRMDLFLLVVPALISSWASIPKENRLAGLGRIILGMAPLVGWILFSTFYYGFPFPNTAYAKLGAGVDQVVLWRQGLVYLLDSLQYDPFTVPVLLFTMAASLGGWAGEKKKMVPLAAGVIIYLGYIVWIGGDFMSGRFFSVPVLLAAGILARLCLSRKTTKIMLVLSITAAIISPLVQNWVEAPNDYQKIALKRIETTGIVNERLYYSEISGLFSVIGKTPPGAQMVGNHWQAGVSSRQVRLVDVAGIPGLEAGPDVHLVDRWAITDPLLARLPSVDRVNFRIGHFERDIPSGYVDSLESGKNRIDQPSLSAFFDRLNLIISGDLWLPGRLVEILKMNAGFYNSLLTDYASTTRRR